MLCGQILIKLSKYNCQSRRSARATGSVHTKPHIFCICRDFIISCSILCKNAVRNYTKTSICIYYSVICVIKNKFITA